MSDNFKYCPVGHSLFCVESTRDGQRMTLEHGITAHGKYRISLPPQLARELAAVLVQCADHCEGANPSKEGGQ